MSDGMETYVVFSHFCESEGPGMGESKGPEHIMLRKSFCGVPWQRIISQKRPPKSMSDFKFQNTIDRPAQYE